SLAVVTLDHLGPRQTDEFGDAQASVVGNLKQQPVANCLRGPEAATYVLTVAGRTAEPSPLARMASSAVCTPSTVARRKSLAGGRQRTQEAVADARIGADCMRRAVGVALDPDRQQLTIGASVGVKRGQPIYLGAEDFGRRRRDDLEVSSSHQLPIRGIIRSIITSPTSIRLESDGVSYNSVRCI